MSKKELKDIEELIELVKKTGIAEIEVKSPEGGSVRIRQHAPSTKSVEQTLAQTTSSQPASHQTVSTAPQEEEGYVVRTPLIGTVYLAPSPGSELFVQIGKRVAVGDTLCLIEAMKTFNKIESDKAGVIKDCLIEDTQAVEYDQPLFVISLDD